MRVGVIDTGLSPAVLAAGGVLLGERQEAHGHGVLTSTLLTATIPPSALLCVPVFDGRGVTTPLAVAEALDRLCAEGVGMILLALGLAHDRDVLRDACLRAVAAGVLLVASAPARGGACYPASYPAVISVCGDARCQDGEASWLGGTPALFGASPLPPSSAPRTMAGASMAAARFVAWAYPRLIDVPDIAEALRTFPAACAYHGRERIGGGMHDENGGDDRRPAGSSGADAAAGCRGGGDSGQHMA